MSAREAILERNLHALFTRSFRPAPVRDGFEREVLDVCVAEIGALQARRRMRAVWISVSAAAAVVLAIAAGLLSRSQPLGLDAIVASGDVAVRSAPDGEWSALPLGASHTVSIPFAGFAEVVTPQDAQAVVAFGPGRSAALDGGAHARIRTAEGAQWSNGEDWGLAIELVRGPLRVERDSRGPPWTLSSAAGVVALEDGTLRASASGDCVDLELATGRAHFAHKNGTDLPLALGETLRACAADLPKIALAPSAPDEPSRVPVDPGTASPASVPPAVEPAIVSGEVRSAEDGAAIDAFRVVLLAELEFPRFHAPRSEVFADAGGGFALREVEPGNYRVLVIAAGFAPWSQQHVSLGRAPVALTIALQRGARIRGRVVERDGGLPVAGAVVISETDAPLQLLPFSARQLDDNPAALAVTAGDGSFELANLSRGTQWLRATSDRLAAGWSAQLDAAGDIEGVVIELPPGGTVTGVVQHGDGTAWLNAALVVMPANDMFEHACLSYEATLTDQHGEYHLPNLPPGGFVVVRTDADQRSASAPLVDVRQATIEAGATVHVDFRAPRRGTRFFGRLLSAKGEPIAIANLSVVPICTTPPATESMGPPPGWRSTTTGADGRFEFNELTGGPYEVYLGARLPMDVVYQATVELPERGELERDLTIPTGSLAGAVRAKADGAGLAMTVIVIEGPDPGTGERRFVAKLFTDDDGRFRAPFLAPGRYRAGAYATQGLFAFEAREVEIGAGETAFDVELEPGASLELRVVDPAGEPVAGALVRLFSAHLAEFQLSEDMRTGADGVLHMRGFHAGYARVQVKREGFVEQTIERSLAPGERAQAELTLRRR